jgi:hypothetical protein
MITFWRCERRRHGGKARGYGPDWSDSWVGSSVPVHREPFVLACLQVVRILSERRSLCFQNCGKMLKTELPMAFHNFADELPGYGCQC